MPIIKQTKIQQSTFQIACKICEHPEARIVHNILIKHFGKYGIDLLNKNGLRPIENLKSVTVAHGNDEVETEIVRRNGQFYHWSNNGWAAINHHDLKQYQLDLDWMLTWVKHCLQLPQSNIAKPLAEKRIWSLGDIRLRDKKAHTIFIRRPRSVEVMRLLNEHLREKYRNRPILIVTTSQYIDSFPLPGNSYMAYIGDLMAHDKFLKFDMDAIHARMFGGAVFDVFSSGYRMAYYKGAEYSFTKIQSAILETLHTHGKPMHKTEFMHLHSNQDDPKHIFRAHGKYHPAWGALIKFDKQGNYWLEI